MNFNNVNKFRHYNRSMVYCLNYIQKKNLDDMLEVLSTAIDTQNKQELKFLIKNWDYYKNSLSTDENYSYIINNSNQINHINVLIKEAKYIVNIRE